MQVRISLHGVDSNGGVGEYAYFDLPSQGGGESIEAQKAAYDYLMQNNTAEVTVGYTMSGGGLIRLEVAQSSLTQAVVDNLYALAHAALESIGSPARG